MFQLFTIKNISRQKGTKLLPIFASKQLDMSKNSLLSTITLKCPRCKETDLFCNKNIYQYKGFFDMPRKCPNCDQNFEIETGFYYGAMYISYGIMIAINILIFTALVLLDIYTIPMFFYVGTPILLLATPYVFKVSRAIWLSFFVK
ncbi:DUF983 domain-containing protein [bacterium]|nr:DUF983 domain-containing protein [bacterium]